MSALRSRGFYDARVTATIANRPISEAAALDAIEAKPDADAVRFKFDIDTGPQYRISRVTIEAAGPTATLPPIDRSRLGLAKDDPADVSAILAAEDGIVVQLRQEGYALVAPDRREVIVDHATREVDVIRGGNEARSPHRRPAKQASESKRGQHSQSADPSRPTRTAVWQSPIRP